MIGEDHELWDKYEKMGQKWLQGDLTVDSFQGYDLNEQQHEFVNSQKREVLISGGLGSGKTVVLGIKLALLCMFFPDNRILLGRKTRKLVETALLPDMFDVFPDGIYDYQKGPGKIVFGNGSEILLWGLESSKAAENADIKKAQQDIKSLNLGAAFIDQLEEVDKEVYKTLKGRLRRKVGFQQINMTTNPANYWAFSYFKQENHSTTHLIETSMLDNKENLPDDYIQDHLDSPERWVKKYVYGEWDESILTEDGVFAEEHINQAKAYVKEPEKTSKKIDIYESPRDSVYQIGVDPSSGAEDPCYITCVDKLSGNQVAVFHAHVPLHAVAEKVMDMADMYRGLKKPKIIVETQGGGNTVIEKLKENNYKLYRREVFGRKKDRKTEKLGWHTNAKTKPQLVHNFQELLEDNSIKIKDEQVPNEMNTFVFKNTGYAAAQAGYHDDAVMGTMLAYWDVEPKSKGEQTRIQSSILSGMNRPSKNVYRQYD